MIAIRDARGGDSVALADLAGQLGYPTRAEDIEARLDRMNERSDERVIVAVDVDDHVIGWTTVRATEHMYGDPFVEIFGFVVDQKYRGKGVGRAMMAEVERWAAAKGMPAIRLNANVTRKEAHRFYEVLGFTNVKQQYVFRKQVGH